MPLTPGSEARTHRRPQPSASTDVPGAEVKGRCSRGRGPGPLVSTAVGRRTSCGPGLDFSFDLGPVAGVMSVRTGWFGVLGLKLCQAS